MGWDSEFLERNLTFKSDCDVGATVQQRGEGQFSSRDHIPPVSNLSSSSLMKTNAESINSSTEANAVFMNSASRDSTQLEVLQSLGITNEGLSGVKLAAPSSAGANTTKVAKKRSRASRRPPTTVLEADSANFRSMVEHLTGIPSPPPMMANRFDFLVRPQANRAYSSYADTNTLLRTQQASGPYANLRGYPGYGVRSFDPRTLPNSSKALNNQALYGAAAQSGMPSLWECEAAKSGESPSMNIKQENMNGETGRTSW